MACKFVLLVLVCFPAVYLCDDAPAPAEDNGLLDFQSPPAPVEFSATNKYSPLYKPANWFKAYLYCLRSGMQLPIIYNEDDISSLHKTLSAHDEVEYVWLGASDLGSSLKFHWVSNGHRLNYTVWDRSQPNGGEGCVIMNDRAKWHDYPCKNHFHFFCEPRRAEC